jgi:HEAT repeat protein
VELHEAIRPVISSVIDLLKGSDYSVRLAAVFALKKLAEQGKLQPDEMAT